ncbi:MAG TPA: LysM peptidoglycan-binding domain-containing protein [Kofleriaceae bacterium]|nr:LysM peptidoglycan-binding domain-containing protein [Kofleriaceae bacterium]
MAVLLLPSGARAQMPTVTPDGKLADPAAPPPPAPSTHRPVGRQYGGQQQGQTQAGGTATTGGEGEAGAAAGGELSTGTGTGWYHTDDYGDLTGEGGVMEEADGPIQVHGGAVPPVHVVRKGDTLWDISWFYFSNAWEWPRVWSYNPEITNPHWIYPGDQVRLVQGGVLPPGGEGGGDQGDGGGNGPDQPLTTAPARTDNGFFELRQLAFVAEEDRKLAIEVAGSPEEKLLLSTGDEIYLSYPKGRPPKVGGRYAVYMEKKRVKHPGSGADAGAYVKIVGEVEVISVKKEKNARAVILDSVEPIERGQQVGPVQKQFKNVETAAAKVDLEGTIVATLTADQLIGARQVVFIDRGGKEGVNVGNRMHVVRRGDAYEAVAGPKTGVGKNDQRFPARSIGEVMVVQVGQHSAIAVVTRSDREFGVGDRVLMTRGSGQR